MKTFYKYAIAVFILEEIVFGSLLVNLGIVVPHRDSAATEASHSSIGFTQNPEGFPLDSPLITVQEQDAALEVMSPSDVEANEPKFCAQQGVHPWSLSEEGSNNSEPILSSNDIRETMVKKDEMDSTETVVAESLTVEITSPTETSKEAENIKRLPELKTNKVATAKLAKRQNSKIKKTLLEKKNKVFVSKKKLKNVSHRLAKAAERVANRMKYAERCKDEFISANGLGAWGQYINQELSKNKFASLLKNTEAFQNFCPGFRYMNKQEKKNLWVFIVMSMSHYESSCRADARAQGPYGIAKGLFQLHQGAENRYSFWDQDQICRRGDSKKPLNSIHCTLSMLNGQVERYNSLFFEGSYWDVLRKSRTPDTHASKIRRAISSIPGCEVRSVAGDEKRLGRSRG